MKRRLGGTGDGLRRHAVRQHGAQQRDALDDEIAELAQRRMAVDLGRLDPGAVGGVDSANPGDPGDRIQTEVDELGVLVDIVDAHLQFRREQRFQEIGDVLRRSLRSGGRGGHGGFRRRLGLRSGGCVVRGGLRRRCGTGIGQEMLHHALQRVTLADEASVVHRQFARIGRFDRIEQRRAEIPLECAHVAGIA